MGKMARDGQGDWQMAGGQGQGGGGGQCHWGRQFVSILGLLPPRKVVV